MARKNYNAEKLTSYRERVKRLKGVPQLPDKACRAITKDREPTPEQAAEIQKAIDKATAEIDRRRVPEPERL